MNDDRDLDSRLLFIAVIVGVIAGAASADNWRTGVGGNSARHSLSTEIGPAAPDLLWDESLPAVVAQQAIIDGGVVVTNRIMNFNLPDGTEIVAHNLHTGQLLWHVVLPYDFPGTSWRSRASAMRDGKVYATRAGNTNLDYLYALDIADGSVLWFSEDLIDEGTTESLAFTGNGDLVAGNFSSLIRISAATGETMWSVPRTCPTSGGCQACVYGDRAYIWQASPSGPRVSAFDVESGQFLYSSPAIGGGFIRQVGLMVGPDGTIYAPRSQNNAITDYFVAYADTGAALSELWRLPVGYVPFASFGVGPDGSVYTYSADKEILRVDPRSGKVLDTSLPLRDEAEVGLAARIAIGADGVIYVTNGGFADGRLFSFNADLSLRWSEPVLNVNVGGPALGDLGTLVVCGTGTDMRAYRTPKPECPYDLDRDGAVGITDLLALLAAWGAPYSINDLLDLLAAWGPCREQG